MIRPLLSALLLALAPAAAAAAIPLASSGWRIDHSPGVPPRPMAVPGGFAIDFPYPVARAGHVHYVTAPRGSLLGKRAITLRYRIDAAPGTRFVPQETPRVPATLSLYLQRRGDNLSGRGRYAFYRWYAPLHTLVQLSPGEHRVTVRLDDNWISVMGAPAAGNRQAFRDALAGPGRVGFVLGTARARGHGVYATGPARMTVTGFQIL